jgi:hypothetical protein
MNDLVAILVRGKKQKITANHSLVHNSMPPAPSTSATGGRSEDSIE